MAAAFFMLLLAPTSTAGVDADIERISFAPRSDGDGYVVRFHTTGRVGAYSVDQPSSSELQVTLFRAGIAAGLQRDPAIGPVTSYRVLPEDDKIMFVFSLRPGAHINARAYPDRDSNDILLNLSSSGSSPVRNSTESSTTAGGGLPDAASESHWRLDCVVIDAGHGGHDSGATYNGVREKDVTLGIARRLGAYIQDRLGVRVVYTRPDDRFIELHERGRIANTSCGKLFISIHANAAESNSAHGTETYFLAPHRSESARNVMARENSVVRLESDPSLYEDFDTEGGIMSTLAFSGYQQESQELASLIEHEFGQRAARDSRGVKQAGFLVLWRASMPAVLVETGFVSNSEEARFLSSSDGQDLIASAVFRAVRTYKDHYERGLRLGQ
ncbi:MAG: N-acetylmuramoyl-L-alanine amidase [Rubricoccaceae bacterium]|nr:N-acetylmuramoyl-L-alanine amidase [Rubricoccaceae bacterium]